MTWACPVDDSSLEPSSWGARNRVRLYPGKVQTWVLARAIDRDLPNNSELRNMARAVLARWFSPTPVLDVTSRSGAATDIKVGDPSPTPPELPTVLQHWTDLPGPLPLLKPGKVLYVPVSFAWRSESETERPWPTWRVSALGFSAGPCPVAADWMLLEVGSSSSNAELPSAGPELSLPEQVAEAMRPSPLLAGALLLFGAAYLINSVKRG
jgi:hypothetical protein